MDETLDSSRQAPVRSPAPANQATLLASFAEAFPWPAVAVDESGYVTHANAAMRERGVALPEGTRIAFAHIFPDYFTALATSEPWLLQQAVTVARETPEGRARERVFVRKVPGGSCVVAVDMPQSEQGSGDAQTARLASLGFMVAGVCHEVANPLTAMQSMVQILRSERRVTRDVLDKGLASIQANVKRLIDIARRITDFSRVGEAPSAPFLLDWAVEEALMLARQHPAAARVTFVHEPRPDARVVGRSAEVQQVVHNIVMNAIQAGATHVRIDVSRSGDRAELAVRDNGPGIPPENLARIFDPFFTTKASGEGTGLGLAISNEIVAEHGGTIRAENNPDGGVTFRVLLPVREEGGA